MKKKIIAVFLAVILSLGVLLSAYQFVSKRPNIHFYIVENYPGVVGFAKRALKITDLYFVDAFFKGDKVTSLYLEIPWKKIINLNLALPKKKKEDGVLIALDNKYNIEFKYRGDSENHWIYPKKSIRLSILDNQKFNDMTSFHLILPEDRGYISEDYSHYIAKKLGLITFNTDFYKLFINGEYQGLYFMIEQATPAFLTRNNLDLNGNVYKNESDSGSGLNAFESPNYWQKNVASPNMKKKDMSEISLLLESIKDDIPPERIIDIDNFIKWNAHSVLVNSTHQSSGGNIITYFDPKKRKFIFFPWDTAQQDHEQIDLNNNVLTSYVLQYPEYMFERNKVLWNYLNNENNLNDDLRYMDDKFEFIKIAMYKDKKKEIPNITFNKWSGVYKEMMVSRYANVKNQLKDSKIDVSFNVIDSKTLGLKLTSLGFSAAKMNLNGVIYDENGEFEIFVDSNRNQILDLEDQKVKDEQILYSNRDFGDGVNSEIKVLPKTYQYFIISKGRKFDTKGYNSDWNFEAENAVTGGAAQVNFI
ncbi:CotH kinase family protein [Patescibacteria group bacterium]|nr:CotH kinase family protein [Patescibacteria group bacterium]